MTKWKSIIKFLMVIILSSKAFLCAAQGPTDSLPGDPGALQVTTVQNMHFGSFTQGSSGGTVVVTNSGTRYVTGTVIPLNIGNYFQAIFEIECPSGSIISILNGPDATLTGSNGGSMSLHLSNSDPASPFATIIDPPGRTQVNIGGTLTVGNAAASPPGSYTGSFYITFNQE